MSMRPFDPSSLEPHDKQVKGLAYEIWAFLCNQNSTRTAERLMNPLDTDEFEAPDREVSARTIRYWAKNENWAERAAKGFRDLAPGIHHQVDQTIVAASVESAAYLREVVNNNKESTKYRVDAAKTLLDRSGHLPWIRPSNDSKPQGPTRDYSEAIAGKNTTDLLAMIVGEVERRIDHEEPAEEDDEHPTGY